MEIEEQVKEFIEGFEEKLKTERTTNEELTDKKIDSLKEELKKDTDQLIKDIRKNNISLHGVEETEEYGKFSFAKAAYAITNNAWDEAGYEKEVMDETRKKAIDGNTGGQGGFLIPTELMNDKIIMPALARSVMKKLGVTFWNGLTADVDIPEASSRPTLVFTPEGKEQAAQNITFANKQLRPKEGGMLTQISNKLLLQAPAEKIVRELMMEGIANGTDKVSIDGTGTTSEPLGILNTAGTLTKDISNVRMKIDDVAEMISKIEEEDFLQNGGGGFLSRPVVKSGLKREQVAQFSGDLEGMPILNPWMSDQALSDILGLTISSTTNIGFSDAPTNTRCQAVVGDWPDMIIGTWGGARLKSSDQAGTAFASNQTWLVIFVDMDIVVRHPKAFNIASNIKTDF